MSNIFSLADIQRLIETFPPPEPRPGKDCLVRSRSGGHLVRSDTIIKRFKALLETSQTPLLVSNLPGELGVQDIRWLLEDDQLGLFYTRDRQRIVSRPRQREIGESLRAAFQTQGVRFSAWAEQYDLSADTLRRITSQDPKLDYVTLEDGLDYSKVAIEELRASVLRLLQSNQDMPLNITSEAQSFIPVAHLEQMCEELISNKDNKVQGNLETKSDGLHYVPQSALSQLQSQKETAKQAFIDSAIRALDDHGFCNLSLDGRPQLLQDVSSIDLGHDIETAYKKGQSSHILTFLDPTPEGSSGCEARLYLLTEDALSKSKEALISSAGRIADNAWISRVAAQEVMYDQDMFIGSLTKENDNANSEFNALNNAILRTKDGDEVQKVFEAKIADLQDSTIRRFSDHIRTKLWVPLHLYSKGVESISDTTLQPRVLEFVTDWARRTLTPEVLLTIKDQKLIVTKTASREIDKFSEAVQAAKALAEVISAAAKLARKLRIDQPDSAALTEIKRSILSDKVGWLKRVKRSSDLLQNLTWILLASRREGLFMSSGKDTSRMIKLYQVDGDAVVGKRLGELRDIIKAGNETDKEKSEMREMARSALGVSNEAGTAA